MAEIVDLTCLASCSVAEAMAQATEASRLGAARSARWRKASKRIS